MKPGYKQTEVGVIPEDWKVKSLGEALTLQRGFDLPFRLRREGSVPIVSSCGIIATHCEPRVSAPGIVTGRYGTIGQVYFVEQDFWPLNTTLYVRSFKGNDPRYLSNLLRTVDFESHSGKSGVPGVNRNDIHGLLIALPPLPEQRAIAEALGDVDGLLAGLDRLLAKKRDLKQAAMQQLLTGQTRLPGFRGEWEVKRLGEIGVFLKGSGVKKDESLSGSLPCIRYGEIYTRHHDYVKEFHSFISADVASTARLLKKGDILFAGSGETREEIGKCVAFIDDFEAYAGGDIVILRPQGTDPLFLGYALNTPGINRQKASKGQGDAVVHIGSSALADIDLALPPLPEQTAIAEVLSDMDAEIAALDRRREKTLALKQGMMQELLTGRTRLV